MLLKPIEGPLREPNISLVQFLTKQHINSIHSFLRRRRIRQSAPGWRAADKRAHSATLTPLQNKLLIPSRGMATTLPCFAKAREEKHPFVIEPATLFLEEGQAAEYSILARECQLFSGRHKEDQEPSATIPGLLWFTQDHVIESLRSKSFLASYSFSDVEAMIFDPPICIQYVSEHQTRERCRLLCSHTNQMVITE